VVPVGIGYTVNPDGTGTPRPSAEIAEAGSGVLSATFTGFTTPHKPRWYIRRVKLSSTGYTSDGAYWGHAAPLWHCHCPDLDLSFHIRGTRDTARCAYQWVRASSDPERAAKHIDATGKIGGWK